jgi:hypothetical protein
VHIAIVVVDLPKRCVRQLLKRLVDSWSNGKNLKLHPKVEALADLVESIALKEIEKVHAKPTK